MTEDHSFIPLDNNDPFIIKLKHDLSINGYPKLPWKSWINQQQSQEQKNPFSWAHLKISKKPLSTILKEYSIENGNKPNKTTINGIINSGNMCYMNSILQVLMHCTPFADLLLKVRNEGLFKYDSDTPILDSLADFIGYFSGLQPSTKNLSSEAVYKVMAKRFNHLQRGRQEDAQEFLGYLLQALHEELEKHENQQINGKIVEKSEETSLESDTNGEVDDTWTEVGKKSRPTRNSIIKTSETAISRIFGGQFKSVLEVAKRPNSITYEPFQQIQLDIDDPQINNLHDAFEHLTRPEKLNYRLNNGTNAQAIKTLTIFKMPSVVIIHLKRFTYTGSQVNKIARPLDIPDVLEQTNKHLFAIVYHHGAMATAGHYTVDLKHEGKWYSIDDTLVTPVTSYGMMEEDPGKSAYLLFYGPE